MIEFYHMENNAFKNYANGLFSVLHDNMSQIAPTGNSREVDFIFWYQTMQEELQGGKRNIIIIFPKDSHEIVGYFQYSIQENVFLMEEIQIRKSYQGKCNIFRDLYAFVFKDIGAECDCVEAYANKKNTKSIAILRKLGLSAVGENKSGTSYHFRGTYADLLKWHKGKHR